MGPARTGSALVVGLLTVLMAGNAAADLPLARLNTLFPMGGKRGASVEITLAGADLEGAQTLIFSQPGIAATPLEGGRFKVEISADAPLGPGDLRVAGAYGISNPRTFVVDDLSEVVEAEPNNRPPEAQLVPVGSVLNGRIDARADVDYYAFEVPQGTTCVIECLAQQIDSRLSGVLTLFSPSGRRIAVSRAYEGIDPRIDFRTEEPGKYILSIADLTFDGSAEYFYRLRIHSGPVIDFAYPPAVVAGSKQRVSLYGVNLPGGKLREAVTEAVTRRILEGTSVPLESLEVDIEGPGDRPSELDPGLLLRPRQAHLDGFIWKQPVTASAQLPVFLGLLQHPILLESEPNDNESTAQVVTLPVNIIGRCDAEGDDDWYRFSLKKDEVVEIEGFAERAGFPIDLMFLLRKVLPADPTQPGVVLAEDIGEYDDSGANVGRFKCDTSSHDPLTTFRAPADGDYLLSVRDRYYPSRGGERFVYRVRIQPPSPDFRLMVSAADEVNPSSLLVRQGGAAFVNVFALRQGGFAEAIQVEVVDLPPGLTASPVMIGGSVSEAPLVFTAAADAPDFTGPITIRGVSSINGTPQTRIARSCTITWPGAGNAPMPSRLSRGFYAAVRGNAPYLLTASPDKVVLGQGSQLTLNLNLKRHWPDFTTKLDGVTAVTLPPNVDNQAVAIPDNGNEAALHLFFKREVVPGTYSFTLRGTGQVPFSKTAEGKKENVAVADPSLPITVTVVPRPVELTADPKTPTIKVGTESAIKVTVNRLNDFAGAVKLELTLPPGIAGIAADPVEVAGDQKEATLTVKVAADVPPGDKANVTVRGTAMVGTQPVTVDDVLVLKITQ